MRGAMLVGMLVVLLIIGLLVMKNMGVEKTPADMETQSETYIEEARNVAKEVDKRLEDIKQRSGETD